MSDVLRQPISCLGGGSLGQPPLGARGRPLRARQGPGRPPGGTERGGAGAVPRAPARLDRGLLRCEPSCALGAAGPQPPPCHTSRGSRASRPRGGTEPGLPRRQGPNGARGAAGGTGEALRGGRGRVPVQRHHRSAASRGRSNPALPLLFCACAVPRPPLPLLGACALLRTVPHSAARMRSAPARPLPPRRTPPERGGRRAVMRSGAGRC